ncbi:hypothetical protein [Vibrio panuliri]|uniref:Uncharacterized protein n=1 Tax=Vibrio panuliri TaxID=1381081 RepID=A0ABX3F9P5_9VIBR|nr:hypothetical protein [Vibrio panuliri]KAB1457536.1 hypothetical protein F7O85_07285 [Vibrio panuliri]OLQ87686.1 hypothetical protein BIY20_13320 [Vibrio panuliri]
MNRANVAGAIVALTGFAAFLFLFASGSNVPVIKLPSEALHGLAFTFAWGFGVPDYLAYTLSIVLMIAVFFSFFRIGKWVTQLLFKLD